MRWGKKETSLGDNKKSFYSMVKEIDTPNPKISSLDDFINVG